MSPMAQRWQVVEWLSAGEPCTASETPGRIPIAPPALYARMRGCVYASRIPILEGTQTVRALWMRP